MVPSISVAFAITMSLITMTSIAGHSGFGSGQRLSPGSFVVLGLITFWVYSALRLGRALSAHFARRWTEVEARDELKRTDPRLAALRATGFTAARAAPWAAAALFVLSAALLAGWFYTKNMVVAGAAPALFYAGAVVLILWALATVRRHETLELHVRERGAGALLEHPDPGDDTARRWERQTNHVIAFLVLGLPIVLSPAIGVHPAIWLPLAVLFHLWGTFLLVGLHNGHLDEEARHLLTAPAREAGEHDAADGEAPPQRARVAVMLTDMQDYSKSMGLDESGAYARLVEHNRIMRAAIAAHHGREIKTIGDAFLVVFRSAPSAVDCALAAQRGFAEYNAGKPQSERILVRIGIHFGDVILTADDVFGDSVNLVARIEPLAGAGGVCVSEPVLEKVRKKIRLKVEPIEGATLKNIAAPPKLYRIRPAS
jgi:class 3 adenylate cyclase